MTSHGLLNYANVFRIRGYTDITTKHSLFLLITSLFSMNNVKVLENETKAPVQFTVYYQHNHSIT